MTRQKQEQKRASRGAQSRIPHFKSIEEEAEFWDTHSTTEFEDEFEDVPDVRFVVVRAQPKKALTVRLPAESLARLTQQAHEQGIRPSTLARIWILEHLKEPTRHRS
jgi:hypothetical protein